MFKTLSTKTFKLIEMGLYLLHNLIQLSLNSGSCAGLNPTPIVLEICVDGENL